MYGISEGLDTEMPENFLACHESSKSVLVDRASEHQADREASSSPSLLSEQQSRGTSPSVLSQKQTCRQVTPSPFLSCSSSSGHPPPTCSMKRIAFPVRPKSAKKCKTNNDDEDVIVSIETKRLAVETEILEIKKARHEIEKSRPNREDRIIELFAGANLSAEF